MRSREHREADEAVWALLVTPTHGLVRLRQWVRSLATSWWRWGGNNWTKRAGYSMAG